MFGFLGENLRLAVVGKNSSFSILSSSRCISSATNQHSLTVSYLINSSSFPPKSALIVSKNVYFETLTQPDSVFSLLKNHGFSQTQILELVQSHPKLLMCNPEEVLLPKLDFFNSIGLSTFDIAKHTLLLDRSLKSQIIPNFSFLKALIKSDEKTVAAINRCPFVLTLDCKRDMASKVNLLRENGVLESSIVTLVYYWPRIFSMNFDKVKSLVEEARDMGFDPSKRIFVAGVRSLKSMSKSTWEKKVDVYKRWNLSEADVLSAFRKVPEFMEISEDKIMGVMDLFVKKLDCESSLIVKSPLIMTFSLEKRLIPRALVLEFLVSKGLVKKNYRGTNFFCCPETTFLQRFVNHFEEASELLRLYGKKLSV
ncbi:unnamed protein product [Dovyalis caffra]|uniref:Uncharacterized protein n=1 Tax=Dovyalis caffra TaxID=77055 RepID=A0AAV1RAN2_9ROSI|nr:unnamed protein product [Dovyalis caffra]